MFATKLVASIAILIASPMLVNNFLATAAHAEAGFAPTSIHISAAVGPGRP